ncbi:glycosyl transferase [Streptomyces longisporoflavus]|uniref:glycosyltransferase n=1 Tax=Streptomyces longisporoflavus TaxID=28044 RepID=UPI00167D4BDB|nr:glycosyltransferase [Streptomyces longisporoflavus]GGV44779.1 glycosyl transferase [Streptomyces longisporoflavus]
MRALHIITGLGVGGAEQQLRLLLRHLPAVCDVVTLTNPGPVAEGLTADGVRVIHLGMSGNRDAGALPRLAKVIRAGRYDLVHTHLFRACLYGRIAARMAGTRAVVATEHSLGDTQMEGRPLTPGVRALYLTGERLGRATVAVSPSVAERLSRWGVPRQRIHVVPNGIDVERFRFDLRARISARRRLGLPDGAFVVGGVGRLAPGKRFDVLLHALAALPGDVRLLLVGGGPEEAGLRSTAARLGVADRVVFAGEQPYPGADPGSDPGPRPGERAQPSEGGSGLPALLAAMDVLASPSPEEAFGLAVVEGLAAGLPVLYVRCPAVEDLPPDATGGAERVTGDPDSFVRALLRVRAAGVRPRPAHEAAHRYSITRSAAQLMHVYEAAAFGPAPPSARPRE